MRRLLNEVITTWLFKGSECNNPAAESWTATLISLGGGAFSYIIILLLLRLQSPSSPKGCRAPHEHYRNGNGIVNSDQQVPLLSGMRFLPEGDLYASKASCLGNEPAVSNLMRFGLPLAIIATIVLLIASQTRVAGSAYFNVHYNDTNFRLPVVKTLLFTRTVHEMWSAHVYVLVAFIVIFSGAWPHLKLLLLLYAWVAPMKWLSAQKRELFLQVCIQRLLRTATRNVVGIHFSVQFVL